MNRGGAHAGFWVLAWLAGCGDPSASDRSTGGVAWSVEIVGHRGILVTGERRPSFDAGKTPRVRVCPGRNGEMPSLDAVRVRWQASEPAVAALADPYQLDDCVFFETQWPTLPTVGEGMVEVEAGDVMLRQRARWDHGPQAHPAVVPFVSRRDAVGTDVAHRRAALVVLLAEVEAAAAAASAVDRPWLLAEQGRVAWRLDRRAAAVDAMGAAADAALAIELPWLAADSLQAAAFYAMRLGGADGGARLQSLIERMAPAIERTSDAQQRAAALSLQGWSRAQSGLLLAAWRSLEAGAADAVRVGDRYLVASIAEQQMAVLDALGRGEEALAVGQALEARLAALSAVLAPAVLANFRQNMLWIRMELIDAGRLPRSEVAAVRAALAGLADAYPATRSQANLAVDRARAALMDDDWTAAAAHIAEARALSADGGGVDPEYVDLLEAEIGLGDRSPSWVLARLAERAASHGSPFCDRHRGWALALEARARRAAGEDAAALALARAAVDHGLGAPVPRGVEQVRANWRPAVATAVALALPLEGPEAAWRVLDRVQRQTVAASLVGHRLGRLADADVPVWANRLARVESACRAEGAGGESADAQASELGRWLVAVTGGPAPPEAAGALDTLIESGDVLLTRVQLEGRWHGFRVVSGRVEHRELPDARLPEDWLRAGRHRYLVDPDELPAAARVTPMMDVSWLPHAGALRASRRPPNGEAPLVLDPACPQHPVDPWAVRVRRVDAPSASARPIGALTPGEAAPVAVVVPCGGFDGRAARQVADALVGAGIWAVALADTPVPTPLVPAVVARLVDAGVAHAPQRAARQAGGWRIFGRADPPPAIQ